MWRTRGDGTAGIQPPFGSCSRCSSLRSSDRRRACGALAAAHRVGVLPTPTRGLCLRRGRVAAKVRSSSRVALRCLLKASVCERAHLRRIGKPMVQACSKKDAGGAGTQRELRLELQLYMKHNLLHCRSLCYTCLLSHAPGEMQSRATGLHHRLTIERRGGQWLRARHPDSQLESTTYTRSVHHLYARRSPVART